MIKKYLHTRFRVSNMEKSIVFYRDILGMKVDEQKTSPRGSKLVFLNFPDSGAVEIPEDLVHLAFEVNDLEVCMQKLEAAGAPITEGPTQSSNEARFIFTEDPDKYEIELIQYKV